MTRRERVEQLAAMTRPELAAECDRILAAHLADSVARMEALRLAGSDPNPHPNRTRRLVADYLDGTVRAVGQISTGG